MKKKGIFMDNEFHTIIVGSGSGGLTVAVGLSKLGKKIALIEKDHIGGDCTNVGCVPSKTLIHASEHVGGEIGLEPEEVLEWVRERRDDLRDEETEFVEELPNVTLIRGHARFVDSKRLEVTSRDGNIRVVSARNIVLATGSSPRRLRIEGLPNTRLLTNENLFELKKAPLHLAIVGGGVIGVEMAFAFRRLGGDVSVIDRGTRLLKVSEVEAGELLAERFVEEDIGLYLESEVLRYDDDTEILHLKDGQRLHDVDRVLVAAGRVPNLDLDLDKAGVEFHERGIPTDGLGRTNQPHIYAIGDINGDSAFTHSANHQGRRLVRVLAFPFLPRPGKQPHYPSATFSDPEVAQVGPTLQELHKLYHPELVSTHLVPLSDTDRGYTMDVEHGFVKLNVMAVTGRLLSATIVAPAAGEMISLLTASVNHGISVYKLADLVFPYPVLSDAIKKAANDYVFSTLTGLHKELFRYLRYRLRRR